MTTAETIDRLGAKLAKSAKAQAAEYDGAMAAGYEAWGGRARVARTASADTFGRTIRILLHDHENTSTAYTAGLVHLLERRVELFDIRVKREMKAMGSPHFLTVSARKVVRGVLAGERLTLASQTAIEKSAGIRTVKALVDVLTKGAT